MQDAEQQEAEDPSQALAPQPVADAPSGLSESTISPSTPASDPPTSELISLDTQPPAAPALPPTTTGADASGGAAPPAPAPAPSPPTTAPPATAATPPADAGAGGAPVTTSSATPDVADSNVGAVEAAAGDVIASSQDAETGPFTFQQHMWDRFDFLWGRCCSQSRKTLEVLVAVFRDRAQLERQYARGLAHNAERMQMVCHEEPASTAVEAMMKNMRHRAEQSAELAEQLEEDVAATVDAVLRQHNEVSKRIHSDGRRLTKHLQESRIAYDAAVAKYTQACTEAEDVARECVVSASSRPPDWRRLSERSITQSRRAAAAERDYRKALQRLNTAAELYERHMAVVLAAMQDMEEKRALCFHDTAMKIAVYDTSWLRNVQYDLDSAVMAIEGREATADLQEFIRAHRSQAPPPARLTPRPHWELSTQVATHSLVVNEVEGMVNRHAEAIAPLLRVLMSPPSSAGEPEMPPESAVAHLCRDLRGGSPADGVPSAEVPGALNAARRRTAFATAAQQELALRQCGVGQDQPPLRVGPPAFAALTALFSAALDGCDREGDAWNGQRLLVLSQGIQSESDDGKVVDILLKVYNHPLWSRVTFWEDSLFAGIAEAHSHVVLSRRLEAPGSQEAEEYRRLACPLVLQGRPQRQVVMTAFLSRYVGFMVSLGIKQEQAHACVQRTLRRHAPLLGATAEAYIDVLTDVAAPAVQTGYGDGGASGRVSGDNSPAGQEERDRQADRPPDA